MVKLPAVVGRRLVARSLRTAALLWAIGLFGCSDLTVSDGVVLGPESKVDGSFAIGDGLLIADGGDATGPDGDQDIADDNSAELPEPASDTANSDGDSSADVDALAPACPPCPAGFLCVAPLSGAAPSCLPDGEFACLACSSDKTCFGGTCQAEPDGQFCRIPCVLTAEGSSCPGGYSCEASAAGGPTLCQPNTGSCSCKPGELAKTSSCVLGNSFGNCSGSRVCTDQGWSACDAPAAQTETCNGADDDCDGQTDEGLGGGACAAGIAGQCPGVSKCMGTQGIACLPTAQTETCNGIDDDCNGATDDGLAGQACLGGPSGACSGWTACQGEGGWNCLPTVATETCNQADDDCDGATDEDFQVQGVYASPAHCGKCNQACTPTAPHTLANCAVADAVPACKITCEDAWIDMDGSLGNGCECLFQSATDEPDGVDQNCDGIDGEIANGVFVAKTGADGNPGTLSMPVATISRGLELALIKQKRDVYVAGGVYSGSVDLAPGVSVYGGYGPGFGQRDPVLFQSAIAATSPAQGPAWAVRCLGIQGSGAPTRLDGVTVLGANAKQPGQSSYGVLSIGCDARLRVTYCQILAGDGATGTPGGSGANGPAGLPGKPGLPAKDIGKDSCNQSDANTGGAPGVRLCGSQDVSGGAGGSAVCPVMDQESPSPACPSKPYLQTPAAGELGQKGFGPWGGIGGDAGADSYIDSNKGTATQCKGGISCNTCLVPVMPRDGADGQLGGSGSPGSAGAAGQALKAGILSAGLWTPIAAGDGGSGSPGSGGGGGGAAGGVEVHDCATSTSQFSDIGGSGGGGGSGGCGGSGGLGGFAGGGSFAVFAVASAATSVPLLWGNSLASGNGGAGGTGGPAGSGGAGGPGGAAGSSAEDQQKTFCTSQGGNGGYGGAGGHGGGGGGGAGGPAAIVALAGFPKGSATGITTANFFKILGTGGQGGLGGPSIGLFGQNGSAGLATAILELAP